MRWPVYCQECGAYWGTTDDLYPCIGDQTDWENPIERCLCDYCESYFEWLEEQAMELDEVAA
jgi:hypothetical protein